MMRLPDWAYRPLLRLALRQRELSEAVRRQDHNLRRLYAEERVMHRRGQCRPDCLYAHR